AIIIYLWRGLNRLRNGQNTDLPPVSVIVTARNEAQHLPACLAALACQTYPPALMQLILVNDRSTDATGAIIAEFCRRHPQARGITIAEGETTASPKKNALATAIQHATGEILLFTDADCCPPPQWVAAMLTYYEPGVGLVAGFSPLISASADKWGGIITLDSLVNALVAAAGFGWNQSITCTGRNLSYTRKVFAAVGGFQAIEHSLSGDDDLFLHQVRLKTASTLRYAISPATIVPALRLEGLVHFFHQRRRHFSAGKYYPRRVQFGYLAYHVTNLALFAGGVGLGCWRPAGWIFAVVLLALKFVADFSLIRKFARLVQYRSSLKYWPGWEFYFLCLNIFVGPTAFFGKIKWK
ncbi:glycosyltransferase, partial [candidate division KSB1 bacterium]|nr:glycosyltransferase [candidate division KSB1 bacterium]